MSRIVVFKALRNHTTVRKNIGRMKLQAIGRVGFVRPKLIKFLADLYKKKAVPVMIHHDLQDSTFYHLSMLLIWIQL